MIFGHLAVSALLHRYLKVDLIPAMTAGVFPDVVDKTLCQVLRLMPNGRMYGHTLLSLAVSTAIVGGIWGRQAASSWALGYIGHLAGDSDGSVPWLYPFASYAFSPRSPGLWEILRRALTDSARMRIELALFAWAVYALCSPHLKTTDKVKGQ